MTRVQGVSRGRCFKKKSAEASLRFFVVVNKACAGVLADDEQALQRMETSRHAQLSTVHESTRLR